jgi:DNA-binding PadR family transcriptional regulator
MTELEGAILGVVRRTGGATAYFVRKVFVVSRSDDWSGSAGAVYPAIARMRKVGWLKESAVVDGRGTKTHVLTAKGQRAHDEWLCDVKRAVGAGVDPFRTRAAAWLELTPPQRRKLKTALTKELERQLDALKALAPSLDESDTLTNQLHIATLEARLRWLDSVPRRHT